MKQWIVWLIVSAMVVMSGCGGGGGGSGFTADNEAKSGESNETNSSIGVLDTKDGTNILDKNSSIGLKLDANSTISNENNYTVIHLKSDATKSFKIGEMLYIPAGVQDQFPLGKSGKIEELTTEGNVTKVSLSDVEFGEVFSKLQTSEVETQLTQDNFIGAIIPPYVSAGANASRYRSRNANDIVLLDGGVVISDSSKKHHYRGDINEEYKEVIKAEVSLNLHVPISIKNGKLVFDFGTEEKADDDIRRKNELAFDITGKATDLKYGFGGDVDEDAVGVKSALQGNLEIDVSLTGEGSWKLGAFDKGWEDFAETKKLFGVQLTGIKPEDKIGKIPIMGLMYSLKNFMTTTPPQEIKQLSEIGTADKAGFVIIWFYGDARLDLTANGKFGAKANMAFNFGVDKERSKDTKDIRTFEEIDKDTPVYEIPYLDASAALDGKLGVSVETDLIVGGLRVVNAGMFVGAQYKQTIEFKHNNASNPDDKSSGIFSRKKQTFDSDWEINYPTNAKVCTEGSLGIGAILDFQIAFGFKSFALEGEFIKLSGQYPTQDAIDNDEPGFVDLIWYKFDASFLNHCWMDDLFDYDQDGMPDSWEDKYSQLDSEINDAMADPDGDGAINYQEYLDTTSPESPFEGKSFILDKPIINNSKVTLKWNKRGSDEVTYKVCLAKEYKDGVECSDLTNKEEIILDATQMSLEKEVTLGEQYYAVVYAIDNNTIQKSNQRNFYIADFVANAGVDKSANIGETVTLIARVDGNSVNKEFSYSWKENGAEIGNEQYLVKKDWSVGEHTITLTITDQYNQSSQDEVLVNITQPTLSKPTNLKVTSTTDAITLNWDNVDNAIAYKVCMAKEPITDADKCSEYSGGQIVGATTNEHIMTDFDFDTTYYFKVKGFREGYLSSWSSEVSAVITPEGTNTVSLNKWDNVANDKMLYEDAVQYCDNKGARLPTIDELMAVTINCGGVYNDFFDKFYFDDSVLENGLYKSCYNKQGFDEEAYYSSTPFIDKHLLFSFKDATKYSPNTSKAYSVRCIYGEVDTTAPVITLNGSNVVIMNTGDEYHELGASTDDGSEIIITGEVDIYHEGNYTITYSSTDYMQNKAISKTRTVVVKLYYQDGDSFETAHKLEVNTARTSSLKYEGDSEYFELILNRSGDINISTTGEEGVFSPIIQFYNSNKKALCMFSCGNSLNKFLDEGIYYITIRDQKDENVGIYTLINSFTPSTTFTRSTLGVVTDLTTNLKWQDYYGYELNADYEVGGSTGVLPYYWKDVNSYCEELSLDGMGWRVPTVEELESIVDKSQSSPTIDRAFRFTASGFYWSSTTTDEDDNVIRSVDFDSGNTGYSKKLNIPSSTSFLQVTFNGDEEYVRCVRD